MYTNIFSAKKNGVSTKNRRKCLARAIHLQSVREMADCRQLFRTPQVMPLAHKLPLAIVH